MFVNSKLRTNPWGSRDIYNCIFHIIQRSGCEGQALEWHWYFPGVQDRLSPSMCEKSSNYLWQWWKLPSKFQKLSSPPPAKIIPSNLVTFVLYEEEPCVFKIILTGLKHKKDLKMHMHPKAFKNTLSWEREPQASFHYYCYYNKLSAQFHIISILKNSHLGIETGNRLTMYSTCHCLDSLAQHHLSLKKEENTNMWALQPIRFKRGSIYFHTPTNNHSKCAAGSFSNIFFIVQEPDLQNNFFFVIQWPRQGSVNRYYGAVCKQAEVQSGDPAKRWIPYRWHLFPSTSFTENLRK